ncbi:MAG TPA: glutathione S-transferase C-terminal domain-containing protein, partial [Steroidobacteraceae bacterium]
LKMQALAQGIADAGITARWESERRPTELRWPAMHDGQVAKIAAACDFLEQELDTRYTGTSATTAAAARDAPAEGRPDIGDIALVTTLSWVEFRRVYDFLTGRPRLARWYAALCARPSMQATTLEGQTHD